MAAALIVTLLAVLVMYPQPAQSGVVSDVLGLDGMTGKVADDIFDGGCKIVGGPVYELGKGIYDTASGAIGMLTGDHSTVGLVAGWANVGLDAISTGLIIYTIVTGTATLPVLVTITATVTAAKVAVEALKNIDKIFSYLENFLGDAIRSLLDVYKPNIYIYADRDMEVEVRLQNACYITESLPPYEPGRGWRACIVNGSINGRGDYLFYEAKVPDRGLQRQVGYVIHGERLEMDLAWLMQLYGFNAREVADFVEYWTSKLDRDRNYIFYPQGTAVVESIMPLRVEPEPDSVYRLWFLIERDRGQDVTRPVRIETVTRSEYAVVEWGGMMENKDM